MRGTAGGEKMGMARLEERAPEMKWALIALLVP